jgi:ABC-type polysaccharide/polyol phosphate export permease
LNLLSHLLHLLLQALDYVHPIFWPVQMHVATRRSRRRC